MIAVSDVGFPYRAKTKAKKVPTAQISAIKRSGLVPCPKRPNMGKKTKRKV